MPRLAVVGSYGVGLTMTVPRLPRPGETLVADGFAAGPGGKGSNQAIGARRLGAQVELLTCIGPDDFGAAARRLWEREGVGASRVKTGTRPTMVGFILVEPGGENRIAIAPGALEELSPSDVEAFADQIAAADLCLVGLEIPVAAAVTALRVARGCGVPTLLNPAPARPLPDQAWHLIDWMTPNREEAMALAGASGPERALRRLRARSRAAVVMTMGADGALVARPQGPVVRIPGSRPRQVVDTTGAGDAFNAALAVALAEGTGLEEAVELANLAGAWAVERPGVVPALPTREQLTRRAALTADAPAAP